MRERLQKFLPLVLLALAMQVLAPIAACLAAGQAISDPLTAAAICHSAAEQGSPDDRSGAPTAHTGVCALCCLAQAAASTDSPPQTALATPIRHAERVVWCQTDISVARAHRGSSAQARAPPHIS